MIPLDDLEDYFDDLTISYSQAQIYDLYSVFKTDFIDNPFEVDGLKVKVILDYAMGTEFDSYPETFIHLITRKSGSAKRVFDPFRANKLHWIKPILLQKDDKHIKYFEYQESDGRVRDYYWYEEKDFIVIMEKITPDYLIITSFHIDDNISRKRYEKRYWKYKRGLK
ncbi:hypothetical protein JW998_06510 [candidate division KSB1 bacterium]|nr:hypothetical protein [candidate division KSB1 bacterium]